MSSALNNFVVKRHLNPFANIASILLMLETANCPANVGKAY